MPAGKFAPFFLVSVFFGGKFWGKFAPVFYFGTATYVDYLTFSQLNPITNPTPLPNATLTIGATARNPNYRGSRVYPNYRGSRTQP